jgi:hypothetical protein
MVAASLLMLSLALVAFETPVAIAAGPGYREQVKVYIAGSDALWSMSFTGINASAPQVSALEQIPGVSSYNVTAVRSNGWAPASQLFGASGYNVIKLPFIPVDGLIFEVSAPDYATAVKAAAQMDSYFTASFGSYANSTGAFTFFSPFSFKNLIKTTLLALLPTSEGGFVSQINATTFASSSTAFVTLAGSRGPAGFARTLVLSSVSTAALDSQGRPNLIKYWGSATALAPSNSSVSSTVKVHVLDGLSAALDPSVTVANNRSAFQSLIASTLTTGESVSILNATVVDSPPQLLVTRVIDTGVLMPGQNVSVTVNFKDLSNTTGLTGIALNDDWWQNYGFFSLVVGTSSNISISSLAGGKSASPTYVLQYTGGSPTTISVPPDTATYSVPTSAGGTLRMHAKANGFSLSLGTDAPVILAYVAPTGGYAASIGTSQKLNVVLKNVGTRTATSVSVNGQSLGGLAPGSTPKSTPVTVSAASLTDRNVSSAVSVSYTTPDGQVVGAVTNPFHVIFSDTGLTVGLVKVNATATMSQPTASGSVNVALKFNTSNQGNGVISSLTATGTLPAGLSCSGAQLVNVTCSGDTYSFTDSNLTRGASYVTSLTINATSPRNYVFMPARVTYLTSGIAFAGVPNALPLPAGVSFVKSFTPSPIFETMRANVEVTVRNAGPFDIYSAVVSTTQDSFDSLPATPQPTTASNATLFAGSSFHYSYGVTVGSQEGTLRMSLVNASFYYGGHKFHFGRLQSKVTIYAPVSAAVTTKPKAPEETKTFTVQVTLSNTAGVGVDAVTFTWPIPVDVSLSSAVNGTLRDGAFVVSPGAMAAGSTYTASFQAVASSGTSIPFADSALSFAYGGVTIGGTVPKGGIAISEDITTRYLIPIGIVGLILLGAAVYIRRLNAAATVPASQS